MRRLGNESLPVFNLMGWAFSIPILLGGGEQHSFIHIWKQTGKFWSIIWPQNPGTTYLKTTPDHVSSFPVPPRAPLFAPIHGRGFALCSPPRLCNICWGGYFLFYLFISPILFLISVSLWFPGVILTKPHILFLSFIALEGTAEHMKFVSNFTSAKKHSWVTNTRQQNWSGLSR